MSSVDFTPLVEPLTNLAVAMVLAGWGFVSHRLNLSNSARDTLDLAVTNAVHYASGAIGVKLSHEALKDVQVRNGLLAMGARYLANSAPDAIKRFGLDDPAIDAKLLARAVEILQKSEVAPPAPAAGPAQAPAPAA